MGFNVAEQGHVVNALAPVDINGGVTSDAWKMNDWEEANIIIQLGVTGAASTITLEECTSAAGAGNTAIAFKYYSEATAAGDTLSTRTSATAAGFATSTNNGVMYCINIKARELSQGSNWLRVVFSDPSAETFGSVAVVLTGGRAQGDPTATAIA